MKKIQLLFFFAFITFIVKAKEVVDYVNPLMGTLSKRELSTGNTYPAIARPWGMNFWMPQTGKEGNGWAYVYTDDKIRGFKQTHQPSPWINDYGQFSIMPITGKKRFNETDRASWFSHKAEIATPYYYKVYLADHDVTAELTPTERAAFFSFTFPKTEEAYIIIDAFDKGSSITIDAERGIIKGYSTRNSGGVPANFKNYFILKFDKPFLTHEVWSNNLILKEKQTITDQHVGAILGFKTKKGEKIKVTVSSSFISLRQAELNLKEIGSKSFSTIKKEGKTVWNNLLNRIKVEGGTDEQYETFYSCLYRSLLFPRKFYEINETGKQIHYSPYNGKIEEGPLYTDTGFWDTFRALFPFLNFFAPSVNKEIQEGLINVYKESGFLPEWASPGHRGCMIGNNSASVVTDAYLKGVKVKNIDLLYKAMLKGANSVHPKVSSTGRKGFQYYNKLGYIPYDVGINENVARTLEYAYDDWCIMKLAKALKRPKKEIDKYAKRAKNYQKVFDKTHLLMRGKNKDGTFQSPFSPFKWGDAFTEGNSWHYTWSVFHDPAGLIKLMGNQDNFVKMLDSVFVVPPIFDDSYYGGCIHEIREMQIMNMGNYAHGNQPIQHMIYLYNYANQPWKTQFHVRDVMTKLYTPNPDGYCGDEDNGQTSVWYVFSALGFYPVCPGSNQYIIGSPLFKKATIQLENGKRIILKAKKNNTKNIYIQSIDYQGQDYTANYFNHFDLIKGGEILFKMGKTPNKKRGIKEHDLPYSMSKQ